MKYNSDNFNNIKTFLQQIWGNNYDTGNFRAFHDSNKEVLGHKLTGTWDEYYQHIMALNEHGFGVFFLVNSGGQTDKEITHYNAHFIDGDDDNGHLPTNWHVMPDAIFTRGNRYHAHWFLPPDNNVTAEQFRAGQKRLAALYGTDPSISNPSRVMRLPLTQHNKDPNNTFGYQIAHANYNGIRHTQDEILAGTPEIKAPLPKPPPLTASPATCNDTIPNIDSFIKYLSGIPAAPQGERNNQLYKIFCHARTFNLSPPKALEVIEANYNQKLHEPLPPSEMVITQYNALKHAKYNDVGTKGVTFGQDGAQLPASALPPPGTAKPEPLPPPAELDDYLEFEDLPDSVVSTAVAGADHGNNARFILASFLSNRLFIHIGIFHWWTGRQYKRLDVDVVKNYVGKVLATTDKSSMGIINGTVDALKVYATMIPELNPPNCKAYFQNGYIDYEESAPMLRPHSIENLNSYLMPFEYNPQITNSPTLDAFFVSIFSGDADMQDKILAVQESLAWAMIRDDLGIHKAIVYRGVARGGKGTLIKLIHLLLGDQAVPLSRLSSLLEDKTMSSMRTANMMIDSDAKPVQRNLINETISMMNKITTNERVEIKLLYQQDVWKGMLNCKMLFACNGLPVMIDDSGAMAGRLHQIMFNQSFLGKEDTKLDAKLAAEIALIGNWALAGLQRLIKNRRFTIPASSKEASEEARESTQPVSVFINDCLIVEPTDNACRAHGNVLYTAWQSWCVANGAPAKSSSQFRIALTDTLRHLGVKYNKNIRIENKVNTGFNGVMVHPRFNLVSGEINHEPNNPQPQ